VKAPGSVVHRRTGEWGIEPAPDLRGSRSCGLGWLSLVGREKRRGGPVGLRHLQPTIACARRRPMTPQKARRSNTESGGGKDLECQPPG
jgi:hypothetical protein